MTTAKTELQTTAGQELAPAQGAEQMMTTAIAAGDTETIKVVAALYREERDDRRRQGFCTALTAAQVEMRPIAADATNPQTRSEYASYAALNGALMPIYTRHGFALSFDTADTDRPGCVRVMCTVSHSSGYERTHHLDMPSDGKGAKGGAVMTTTHAVGAATSYGMRYLLKMIFNVAVGECDTDGNMPVETITPEQAATIERMLKEVPTVKRAALLKWAGVASIEAFPASLYKEARATFDKHQAKVQDGAE